MKIKEELSLNDSILLIKRVQEHLTYEEQQYLMDLADKYQHQESIDKKKAAVLKKIDKLKEQLKEFENNDTNG